MIAVSPAPALDVFADQYAAELEETYNGAEARLK